MKAYIHKELIDFEIPDGYALVIQGESIERGDMIYWKKYNKFREAREFEEGDYLNNYKLIIRPYEI